MSAGCGGEQPPLREDDGADTVVCLGRRHCVAILALPVLGHFWLASQVGRLVQVFAELVAGLGAELPLPTRIAVAAANWHLCWLVPLGALAALWDFARRERPSALHLTSLLVGLTLLGMVLVAFFVFAMYSPVFDLINKI